MRSGSFDVQQDQLRQIERELADLRQSYRERLGRDLLNIENTRPARVTHGGTSGSDYGNWKKPNCMPELYDGSTPISDFFCHFDMVSIVNNWDDRQKAAYLGCSLRGPAQEVLSDMDARQRFDFLSLKDQLCKRFNPETLGATSRAELRNLKRSEGQKLTELGANIRKLIRRGYHDVPSEAREVIAIEAFMNAIDDYDVKFKIHERSPRR